METEKRESRIYLFNEKDQTYDSWDREYRVEQWISADKEDIVYLSNMR